MTYSCCATKDKGKAKARTKNTSSGSLKQGDFPTKATKPSVPVACSKSK